MKIIVNIGEEVQELVEAMAENRLESYPDVIDALYRQYPKPSHEKVWSELMIEIVKDIVRALSKEQAPGVYILQYLEDLVKRNNGKSDQASDFYSDIVDAIWLRLAVVIRPAVARGSLWIVRFERGMTALVLHEVGDGSLIREVMAELSMDYERFQQHIHHQF